MIFNSVSFALFFATFLVVYWSIVPAGRRNAALVLGSYFFYGWWDWRFLGLLWISTILDFFVGRQIHRTADPRRRRRLLHVSLGVNLGILGLFKYANFFIDSLIDAGRTIGLDLSGPTIQFLLPVGISFYTFQTMSYTLDIYRRRIEPCQSLVTFATFVAYFPQLVAGPIERAQRLLPVLERQDERHFPTGQTLRDATQLILIGLLKKVVIADGVASVVNETFQNPDSHSTAAIWVAVIGFSIQIYGDFSGYTDIARGVSLLLGIDLVVNFREPYLSRNITEFWRRWHISLSDWLRDYLYISLGGNRHGVRKTYRNLMLTMLLGGLWHGASWNFVIWGGLHGLFLVIHRLRHDGRVSATEPTRRDIPAIVATFLLVSITWIFFRAPTLGTAIDVLTGMLSIRSGTFVLLDALLVTALGLVVLLIDVAQRRVVDSQRPRNVRPDFRSGVALGLMIGALLLFSGGEPAPFIYFQF